MFLVNFISLFSFSRNMTNSQKQILLTDCRIVKFYSGDTGNDCRKEQRTLILAVFEQFDYADSFYLIVKGTFGVIPCIRAES